MKILILICALELSDCSIETATVVIQGPEARTPAQCGLHGQAHLAGTATADYFDDDHYLRVVCKRSDGSRTDMSARP
jgi:hypothetical protein